MALREIGENGEVFDVFDLKHRDEFDRIWLSISHAERAEIESEINHRLDHLITSPDPNWGSITNTSIEGGKCSPETGLGGDWSGTPFIALYEACGLNKEVAGMFYGNVWKLVIIQRPEIWIGVRSDPTFPQRGITLMGKTYFLHRDQ